MALTKQELEAKFSRPSLKEVKDYIEAQGCSAKIKHITAIRNTGKVTSCAEQHPDDLTARVSYQIYRYDHGIYLTDSVQKLPALGSDGDAIPDRIIISIPDVGTITFVRDNETWAAPLPFE